MKNHIVGIYHSHTEAQEVIKNLVNDGFDAKKLSLIGRAEEIEGNLHLTSNEKSYHAAPVAIGTSLGTVAGLLAGAGIFLIPGLGFLYGAGALVGAIAGFDFGLIGGGAVSIIAGITDEEHDATIDEHLRTHHVAILYSGARKDEAFEKMKEYKAIDVYK